jgi:hypothetical protein
LPGAFGVVGAALILAGVAGASTVAPSPEDVATGAGAPPAAPIADAPRTAEPPRTAESPPAPPSGGPRSSPTTPPATEPALVVGLTSIVTWDDARGVWRGRALAEIRNEGEEPLLLQASSSDYAVVNGAGAVVAADTFDGAVPPVILPGRTGYLVGAITFKRRPANRLDLRVEPVATLTGSAPVPLAVAGVRLSIDRGELVVTGTVLNHGEQPVTGTAVGVVLLDEIGRPIAATLGSTDTDRLEVEGRSTFRAVSPAAPTLDLDQSRRLVDAAWGMPAP